MACNRFTIKLFHKIAFENYLNLAVKHFGFQMFQTHEQKLTLLSQNPYLNASQWQHGVNIYLIFIFVAKTGRNVRHGKKYFGHYPNVLGNV